jgi:hypothetical protein
MRAIAHAPEDVAYLLAEVGRLEGALAEQEAIVEAVYDMPGGDDFVQLALEEAGNE